MDRKIKLYTNRITWDITPILEYAKEYYAVHRINLLIDVVTVDVHGYTSIQPEERPGIHYYILDGAEKLVDIDPNYDVIMFMFDQAEWRTPLGSPYPLLPNTPTSDCYLVGNKPFINYGIYSPDLNSAEIVFIHENMHALVKEANLKGFPTQDCMDMLNGKPYYLNNLPNDPNSNFINQWELLYNYLKTLINYELPI